MTDNTATTASTESVYQPQRLPESLMLPVRNMRYHLRVWQPQQVNPALPLLVMTHGWMDVAASYQFVVDAFSQAFMQGRTIVAPDWRGFGASRTPAPCDSYYYPDYLADLDVLLDHFSPSQPVDLVGHSMGGNVVSWYAGIRPERIRRLVNLEGFGMPPTQASQAPARLTQWLDELRGQREGAMDMKTYASQSDVANRLQKTNHRLSRDKALWLAGEWAAQNTQGRWVILGDASHKIVNPQLYRVEEALACMSATTAPVLAVETDDNHMERWWQGRYTPEQYHERLKSIPNCRIARVENAGHMLHHDQPQAVAQLIESFCQSE